MAAPDAVLRAQQEKTQRERLAHHTPEAQAAREQARLEANWFEPDLDENDPWEQKHSRYEDTLDFTEESSRIAFDHYKIPVAIVVGILMTLGVLWMVFFWEKSVQVEVESASWQRAQVIEQYKVVHDSDWCSSKPHDAYDIKRSQRVHHHETVTDCHNCDCHPERYQSGQTCRPVCHTERSDNGNGSFSTHQVCHDVCDPTYATREVCRDRTHQEPVYAAHCSYSVDRWQGVRKPSVSGNADQTPVWPVLSYQKCPIRHLGCERPGARSQWYKTRFLDLDEEEQYECEWDQKTWDRHPVGSQWEAIVKVVGGRFQCDSLTRLDAS